VLLLERSVSFADGSRKSDRKDGAENDADGSVTVSNDDENSTGDRKDETEKSALSASDASLVRLAIVILLAPAFVISAVLGR